MQTINSKEELIERLKDIRAVEVKARDTYKNDVLTFKNARISSIINEIEQDEEFHIELLDELITMLE